MNTKKYHYNTTTKMLDNLKLIAEIRGIKQLNSTIDYLILNELERLKNEQIQMDSIDIEEYTEQLNQILLNGNKKDLEQFILSNNISLSNYEYWELLQKLNNREIFE